MKGKKDQRKKGFKPPFFKKNSQENQQGHSTQNEHKMVDSFGKRPRKYILYNVGDVREITYIGTTLTKEKE
jgi:hypothetical protein